MKVILRGIICFVLGHKDTYQGKRYMGVLKAVVIESAICRRCKRKRLIIAKYD